MGYVYGDQYLDLLSRVARAQERKEKGKDESAIEGERRIKPYPGCLINRFFDEKDVVVCHVTTYPHAKCEHCHWMWKCKKIDERKVNHG